MHGPRLPRIHRSLSLVRILQLAAVASGTLFGSPAPGLDCRADVDGSRSVNSRDIACIISAFGLPMHRAAHADVNDSGAVDLEDVLIALQAVGESCPRAHPKALHPPRSPAELLVILESGAN